MNTEMLRRAKPASLITFALFCLLLSGCSIKEPETEVYVLPNVYVGARALIDGNKNSNRCEDIYQNEDGSLTLVLTERQREKWTAPGEIETVFLPLLKGMGISIEYSDDYTQMSISAPGGVAKAASPMIHSFAWHAELVQILGGAENWSLEVTVVNQDTGEIEQQVTLPDEELDWSFLQ